MSNITRLIQAKVDADLFEEFKVTRHAAGKSITRLFEDFMRMEVLKECEARFKYLDEVKSVRVLMSKDEDDKQLMWDEMIALEKKINQMKENLTTSILAIWDEHDLREDVAI